MASLRVTLAFIVAVVASLPSVALAQTYPARPVTLIVPYGAGGPTDAIARVLVERMRASLGQPVIIENVAGASGSIGIGKAIRSAPDGYTIVMGTWATHVLNGVMLKLPYDIANSLDPVAHVVSDSPVLVANKTVPADSLQQFIAWLRANPDKTTQGTGGPGSVSHILGALFQKQTGTRFQLVPYKSGVGVAVQDMTAGHIDFLWSVAANAVTLLKAGTVKGFAVTSKERLGILPDVPTVDEAGLPGFYQSNWHGIWAPRGTPKTVKDAVNAAIVAALEDGSVRDRLIALGQQVAPKERQTPDGLESLQKAEIEKWWPIIREAGIKPE